MEKTLRNRIIGLQRLAGRLGRDVAGNTLAIVAAAIIPLAALIGSGVDMSRAYMAQSRLQQACDAGVLAGRRAMTAGTVDSTVRAEALKFFQFNFPTGQSGSTTPPYRVAAFTPNISEGSDSAVVITAATTVPTSIMSMFGFNNIPISATCDAKQDFVNTDVMLVLDNTGSMNCLSSEGASTSCPTEKSGAKIADLRAAVMAFYDALAPTQTMLESHGLRMQYGIVPYSGTVNVGKLLSPSYLKSDNWDYQSRVANYNTVIYVPTDTTLAAGDSLLLSNYQPGTQRFKVTSGVYNPSGTNFNITSSNCTNFGNNASFSVTGASFSPSPSGATLYDPDGPAGLTTTQPPAPTEYVRYQFARSTGTYSGSSTCDRILTATRRTYTTRYSFTNWTYKQTNYDVSSFITGSAVTVASNTGGTVAASGSYSMLDLPTVASSTSTSGFNSSGSSTTISGLTTTTSSWDGCIEERKTSATPVTSSTSSIPSDALDLMLESVPTTDPDSKWKPYWDDVTYYRTANSTSTSSGSKSQTACPAQAARLKTWDRTTMETYVNGLVATGGTYSDIGMAWGGRLLSRTGIFAGDNPTTYGNMQVARYLILMTDGYVDTGGNYYSAWGIEQNDRRASGNPYPGDTTDTNNHMQRFTLLCNTAKSMGIEVWVIGFGSGIGGGLDSTLENCATDKNKAKTAANKTALIDQFKEIAKDIGALRLTK